MPHTFLKSSQQMLSSGEGHDTPMPHRSVEKHIYELKTISLHQKSRALAPFLMVKLWETAPRHSTDAKTLKTHNWKKKIIALFHVLDHLQHFFFTLKKLIILAAGGYLPPPPSWKIPPK